MSTRFSLREYYFWTEENVLKLTEWQRDFSIYFIVHKTQIKVEETDEESKDKISRTR